MISSVACHPRIFTPKLYVEAQIKGNVHGFPTAVPIADVKIFPLTIHATRAAIIKWKPTNGVNEIAAPQAKPEAIA